MPVQVSYPGVYIEEVPSGVRTIVGVSTSTTAFVGRAPRGPVDRPVTVTSYGVYERVFGGLWKESRLGFAVRDFFLNGGGTAVVVRVFHAEQTEDDPPEDVPARSTATLGTADALVLEAADEGVWGDRLRVRVDHDTRDPDDALGEETDSLFNLTVRDGATGAVEEHRNVVVAPEDHPRRLDLVLANDSSLVRVVTLSDDRPEEHADPAVGQTVWDDIEPSTDPQSSTSFADGSDGLALDDDDFIGTGLSDAKEGLFALERTDIVNLIVIPPYDGEDVGTDVITAAAVYAEQRRAVLLVDSPADWDSVADVQGGLAGLGTSSRNAALYFPRLRQSNPLRDRQVETFAATGAVAGVLARTDAQRGVWKAPAGLEAVLNGVPELSVGLTDAEIGLLNPLGVNCLRAMPGAGRVVWGARTMQGADRLASEWKYLPVRRTALFIEESLFRGTQWVVFEPNDEPLWAQIRLSVGTFMDNLFRQGAFQGTTPREAYFVKCDRETTTQADIDLGIVNIHVGFAPLKPAEFVVIRLQQLAGASAA